jgi:hypothetical protein
MSDPDNLTDQMLKVAKAARGRGREVGRITLAAGPTKPDPLPFYTTWELHTSQSGQHSWRFLTTRAVNGQTLTKDDVILFLTEQDHRQM